MTEGFEDPLSKGSYLVSNRHRTSIICSRQLGSKVTSPATGIHVLAVQLRGWTLTYGATIRLPESDTYYGLSPRSSWLLL